MAKGWKLSHTKRLERFQAKIQKTEHCWIWIGYIDWGGYGRYKWEGKSWIAHRLMWRLFVGDIPHGMCVCHTCDNRKCVNPAHLFLGTYNDNIQDMVSKGRARGAPEESNAKLTKDKVQTIRNIYKQGGISTIELGTQYGVYHTTIARIVNKTTWKQS